MFGHLQFCDFVYCSIFSCIFHLFLFVYWCSCSCLPPQGNNDNDVDFDDDDDDDFDLSSLDEEGYQDFARPKYSVCFVKLVFACCMIVYVRSPIVGSILVTYFA